MNAELKTLALDTATEACSVALYLDGKTIQRLEVEPNAHSKLILGMVESLLRDGGLRLDQLDAIAVDVGPGSFTGVRIGIGVAQGLAYGAGIKAIAVNSLETLAVGSAINGELALPAIDARMGQVYYALYRTAFTTDESFPIPQAIIEPSLIEPDRLSLESASSAPNRIIGVGSGWDVYAQVMQQALARNDTTSEWRPTRHPEAASVARIAAARGMESAISPLQLSASYVRDEIVAK